MSKNTKIVFKIIIILLINIFAFYNNTYADPNSSKGFAEYTDIEANKQSKEEEQKQENHNVVGKSTNNYLEMLEVEGYELMPEFDKQTLEYSLNKEIDSSTINIIAKADDSKARVDGAGKINIKETKTICKVEVTAESGTVRTYVININSSLTENSSEEKNEKTDQIEKEEKTKEEKTKEEVNNKKEEIGKNFNIGIIKDNLIIIIVSLCLIIILIILLNKRKKKNNRKNGKHSN